jgi:SAM-dependent methyltransferase
VGCGTGRYLALTRSRYDVVGLDLNANFLEVARKRLGDSVELYQADMSGFDIERRFDVITCLFCSITYLVSAERFRLAISSMARHLAPGGILVIEPWLAPEQFWRNHIKLNVSEHPDRKIVWMYVGKEENGVVTSEIHYLIGEPGGVTHEVEVLEQGLFDDRDYRSALSAAGLEAIDFVQSDTFRYGLYCARKPWARD